jgi:hypothetical protein
MTDPQVRIKAISLGDGLVRDGEWAALHVALANLGEPVTGRLVLQTTDSAGIAMEYAREVELPAGSVKEVKFPWKPGFGGPTRAIRFEAGTRSVETPFNIRFVGPADIAIAWMGEESAGLQTLRDTWGGSVPTRAWSPDVEGPAFFDEDTDEGDKPSQRTVFTGQIPELLAPDRSNGYDTFDSVVWVDADPTRLSPEQSAALHAWVAGGGHLLLTVTTRWRQVQESPISELLPVELEGLRDGAGADELRQMLGLEPLGEVSPEAIATLRDVPGRYAVSLDAPEDGVSWAVGTYGLGTVSVITVDPRSRPLSTGIDRSQFWRHLLFLPPPGGGGIEQAPLDGPLREALNLAPRSGGGFMEYSEILPRNDANWAFRERIRTWLEDIPGVAPLPISWLLVFSGLYLLVIGPVDYLVLRAIGRQPWTWVTFPASIAVFSAVALVGVSYVKGSQAVVTRFEVVDLLPGTPWMRGASEYGVWSTRSASLSLRAGAADGLAELVPAGSYQTNPRVEHGTAGTTLHWGADTWTLAYVRTTWVAPAAGKLEVTSTDGATFTVTNRTPWKLKGAYLHIQDVQYLVGDLEPEGTSTVRLADLERRWPRDPGGFDEERPGWATEIATNFSEPRRGELNFGEFSAVFIAEVSSPPVETSVLDGLTPLPKYRTVLRVPARLNLPMIPENP